MALNAQPLPSSYRDPSGFMFETEGVIYRQVNQVFREHFDHFISSGCYRHLVEKNLLVPHQQVDGIVADPSVHYTTLLPQRIPYISYPYEWCFHMLKDAALLTLQLVKECLPFGVLLKDATAFNVQWSDGKPVFIDTLSFEKYQPGRSWNAYRQFCENFLAPLLLMHYTGQPLQNMLLAYPDGIPLSMAASLLPARSRFSIHTYLHIHLHAGLSVKNKAPRAEENFSQRKLEQLVESLASLVRSLKWNGSPSAWDDYYREAATRNTYLPAKKQIIENWLKEIPATSSIIDLGANDGAFSVMAAAGNRMVIAVDSDHTSINRLYLRMKNENITGILPLVMDLSHPSPSIGVNNRERMSFLERTHVQVGLGLALIHHLCLGKNIPFEKVVAMLSPMMQYLVIEFVPKTDEKVQFMLRHRKDIYADYTLENFEAAFERSFSILQKKPVEASGRTLYFMKKR
jgi:hypothetical protein